MTSVTPQRAAPSPGILLTAALVGFVGVALGAWGAHGAQFDPKAAAWWQTGVHYQQVHAVVLLVLGFAPVSRTLRGAAILFVIGILLFAGTLYAMALGGPRILGAITPIGGLALLAGWAGIGVEAITARVRRRRSP